MPHEDCVNLIKRAGNTLALKVVTANMSTMTQSHYAASHSLPYRRRGKSKKKRKENNDQGSSHKPISAPLRPLFDKPFGGR